MHVPLLSTVLLLSTVPPLTPDQHTIIQMTELCVLEFEEAALHGISRQGIGLAGIQSASGELWRCCPPGLLQRLCYALEGQCSKQRHCK